MARTKVQLPPEDGTAEIETDDTRPAGIDPVDQHLAGVNAAAEAVETSGRVKRLNFRKPVAAAPAEEPAPDAPDAQVVAGELPAGCPFQRPTAAARRLKAFLWGDTGTGKTTLALHFPAVAVIDMEKGADHYADLIGADGGILKASTADQVMEAIDWLASNDHPFKTLVMDPVTVYWEALQKKWSEIFLRRNKSSKGYKFEFYDLQAKDWQAIKGELKSFARKLVALDMNVILTAREKTMFSDDGKMTKLGVTFDGEKSLPYLFDVVIHMTRDASDRYVGKCLKDRTRKLPTGDFEISYDVFAECFGEGLTKGSTVKLISVEQQAYLEELLPRFNMPPAVLARRLATYGANEIEDLTAAAAAEIITKLEAALPQE